MLELRVCYTPASSGLHLQVCRRDESERREQVNEMIENSNWVANVPGHWSAYKIYRRALIRYAVKKSWEWAGERVASLQVSLNMHAHNNSCIEWMYCFVHAGAWQKITVVLLLMERNSLDFRRGWNRCLAKDTQHFLCIATRNTIISPFPISLDAVINYFFYANLMSLHRHSGLFS